LSLDLDRLIDYLPLSIPSQVKSIVL
jgi:hypothetical protein